MLITVACDRVSNSEDCYVLVVLWDKTGHDGGIRWDNGGFRGERDKLIDLLV